ncbi:MAG: winged helix-turn-helix transcriptional regulator [Methanobacteriota archaeon]|nr:MAG: winged helix-turn-helix transcriptional regulator [Euryarchaeota archaeon]
MPADRKSKIDVSPTQVKILSDPTRLRILSMLFEQEASISGLAKALGLTPATVHHHVNRLRKAKLIRPTRSEMRGNLAETYYEMPAKGIDSSHVWDRLKDEEKVAYRLAVLGMLKGMINDSVKAIQARGTVEWEVGRLLFYKLPWRRDAITQVEEVLQDTKRRLARLEESWREETGAGRVAVVITMLPA